MNYKIDQIKWLIFTGNSKTNANEIDIIGKFPFTFNVNNVNVENSILCTSLTKNSNKIIIENL